MMMMAIPPQQAPRPLARDPSVALGKMVAHPHAAPDSPTAMSEGHSPAGTYGGKRSGTIDEVRCGHF